MAEKVGPPTMSWSVNSSIYERFQDFKYNMESYLESHYEDNEEKKKVYCLKTAIDDKTDRKRSQVWITTWKGDNLMDNTTEWDLSTWWKLLDQKFAPHKRTCEGLAARNLFLNFQQGELSFLEWETKLKHLILECKYPKETTSVLFRDLLAAGCKSSKA